MSRESALARGRSAAEISMVDACTIRRITGTVSDDFSGEPVETYLSPDPYVGKCRVQNDRAQAQEHNVAEDYQLLLRLGVQLPMSVVGLEVGDIVTITSSAHDPDLPGRVFLIRDLAHKTDATARRVQVTERTS
jgi:hypothetical protein